MQRIPLDWLAVLLASVVGCGQHFSPPQVGLSATTSDAGECEVAPAAATDDKAQPANAWVVSDDRQLALRLSADSATVKGAKPIVIVAELRNAGTAPVNVIRPFGDWYLAEASGLKIWSRVKRIDYSGPTPGYVIAESAFATLKPGEAVKDTLKILPENFAGSEQPETYVLRYDYSYDGTWDTLVNSKYTDIWRGQIVSREVRVVRK
jgi:hypothetical protein